MFPGSHDMLVHQNEELNRLQLPRIFDEGELIRYEASQVLVPVNETEALKIAADLPESRRYCRPWTRDFLQDFSQAYYNHFHSPLQVNSLVRTVEQQQRLRRHNRYAAPEWGDTASTHLTGVTFDLSRRGLTGEQYGWILGLPHSPERVGHGGPNRGEPASPARGGVREILRSLRTEGHLVGGERAYRNQHVGRRVSLSGVCPSAVSYEASALSLISVFYPPLVPRPPGMRGGVSDVPAAARPEEGAAPILAAMQINRPYNVRAEF